MKQPLGGIEEIENDDGAATLRKTKQCAIFQHYFRSFDMAPIEVYIDGKFSGRSSSGFTEIKLPDPPGGKVIWMGDESESGYITTSSISESEFFQFTEPGQEAPIEIPKSLSAGLFPNAANTPKEKIVIKRIDTPQNLSEEEPVK